MILRTGRIDDNVLDRSVRKRLGSLYLGENDRSGSGMTFPYGTSHMAAQYQEKAAAVYSYTGSLRSGHIAELSVTGAVNGLAVQGIVPTKIRTDILLPIGSEEQLLRDIEDEIRDTAERAGVVVAGGHTEVTAAVTRPVVLIESFGIPLCSGTVSEARTDPAGNDGRRSEWTGADLFAIGHIGLSGTWLLAEERREELEARFPVQLIRRASAMKDKMLMISAVEKFASAVSGAADMPFRSNTASGAENQRSCTLSMVHVSDGGIYAGLWKLARRLSCGFEVNLPEIPVYQETIEICNFCGINPYQMSSEGCLLAVAGNGTDTDLLLENLEKEKVDIRMIGRLTEGKDKIIVNGEERQNLNRPAADALISLLG